MKFSSADTVTPSRVRSPAVQWMRAFGYTPPSSARAPSGDRRRRAPPADEDVLPTEWHHGEEESDACTPFSPDTDRRGNGESRRQPQTPRSRSRRLGRRDTVEIVCKTQSRRDTANYVSLSAHTTVYPSPPTCGRSHGDDVLHLNMGFDERATPEPTLPLKTSKYFSPASVSPTCSTLDNFLLQTPPNSPVYNVVDKPRQRNTSLFDDLMIMLKRLKPILVQDSVGDDPWKVLIAVRLLNVTTGKAAIPVFCKIISRWPTPQDLAHASPDELVELLRPLGLYNKRARWLRDMSQRFLEDRHVLGDSRSCPSLSTDEPTIPAASYTSYPGVGPYALDSLRIFCADDADTWQHVMPRDKELIRYLRWRWAVEQRKVWYPDGVGVIGNVDVPYLITLVDELAVHYDVAVGGEGYMYHFCNDLGEVLSGEV